MLYDLDIIRVSISVVGSLVVDFHECHGVDIGTSDRVAFSPSVDILPSHRILPYLARGR